MLLLKTGTIKPMLGVVMEKGGVLIGDDGRIAAVGENLAWPEGCQVTDAQGRL